MYNVATHYKGYLVTHVPWFHKNAQLNVNAASLGDKYSCGPHPCSNAHGRNQDLFKNVTRKAIVVLRVILTLPFRLASALRPVAI